MPSILKRRDIIVGIVLIALGVFMFVDASNIRAVTAGLTVVIGSDFLPKIAAIMFIIFGVLFIVKDIVEQRFINEPDSESTERKHTPLAVFISIGLLVVYAYIMPFIGFMISTTLYLIAQITVLAPKEKRNMLVFVLIAVITAVVLYFAFVNIFSLMLPRGRLF